MIEYVHKSSKKRGYNWFCYSFLYYFPYAQCGVKYHYSNFMSEVMLKLYCYKDKKYEYLKWVDKYVNMTIDERWEEELKFRNKHFAKSFGDKKPLTLWQKIKNLFDDLEDELKKEEEEIEWEDAFNYFKEIDDKIMGDVHEKMGLPRNGIRPDYC